MTSPLTPEQVRSLCSRLGITAQRPLSEAEVKRLASNKPDGIHPAKKRKDVYDPPAVSR